MLPVCFPIRLKSPSPQPLASFFADVISGWTVQSDQSATDKSGLMSSDLQIAKINETSFTMEHKMALLEVSQSDAKTVGNPQYYLSTDADYYWNHATTTVKSSVNFTSQTNIPYNSSNTLYYIIKSGSTSTTIASTNDYTNADNDGNSWSETYSNITEGAYYEYTPTVNMTYVYHSSYTLELTDVLYSDGALSKLNSTAIQTYSSRTAIGLVFSLSPSSTDQSNGWTHGYVWALKNAVENIQWQSFSTTALINTAVVPSGITSDKEGYTKTHAIKNYAVNNYGSLTSGNYTAVYYALNYGVAYPSNSSGWFLQSCGQMYDIAVNIGGLSSSVNVESDRIRWAATNAGTTAVTNFNAKLNILINAGQSSNTSTITIDSGSSRSGFFTSSERSATNAYEQYFVGYSDTYPVTKATDNNRWMVRPVLAF